jgi:hypothetical protein
MHLRVRAHASAYSSLSTCKQFISFFFYKISYEVSAMGVQLHLTNIKFVRAVPIWWMGT